MNGPATPSSLETRDSKWVIVTGGAGFIGSHLTERLLADGKSVVVIDDLSTGNLENLRDARAHPRLRMLQARVSECGELGSLVAQAESIYHLAAAVGVDLVLNSPVQSIKTNLRETESILEAASVHKVPVLLTSSSEVYGASQKESFSEDDDLLIGPPTRLRWSYACSKLMDEFMALAYAQERGLPVIIARLFNTVGPRQTGRYGMVLPRFIEAAKAGRPLRVYGDGRQTRCFCHVADTVEALRRLQNAPQARGKIVNVGSTESIRIMDLARAVIRTIDSGSTIELVPYSRIHPAGYEDMRHRQPCVEKLVALVGFSPQTPLAATIREMMTPPCGGRASLRVG
jgi:UDP-glucose 4-epimerase